MKYFDAFSGYGGFSLGIQRAYELSKMGIESENSTNSSSRTSQYRERPLCIGYSEINKYAIETYSKHFPEHKNYGDLTKINAEELPDFDLFTGGFPCQAFSIAGKRKGFDDTRGTLFFDIARILRAKRPRLLLLENVKGLLSHDNGKTFSTIISTLDEIGYDLQWQVLNAKHFGVPQNRERVFIVGHLRGTSRPKVFPITGQSPTTLRQDTKAIALHNTRRIATTSDTVNTLSSTFRGNPDGDGRPAIIQPVLTPDRVEKRQNCRRFKDDGEPSFTVTAQDKHGVYDGLRIRRLTPTECERLMGLPDNWTEGVSDTQRYKLCGNGVVVNVVEEIIKRLL